MADRAMTPSALWLVTHQSQCLSLHMKQLGGLTLQLKQEKESLWQGNDGGERGQGQ